jgi:hypothetical protein
LQNWMVSCLLLFSPSYIWVIDNLRCMHLSFEILVLVARGIWFASAITGFEIGLGLHGWDNREEGVEASKALRLALKQYDLKFSIILNDPDMASFRAMTEFKQLQDEVNFFCNWGQILFHQKSRMGGLMLCVYQLVLT